MIFCFTKRLPYMTKKLESPWLSTFCITAQVCGSTNLSSDGTILQLIIWFPTPLLQGLLRKFTCQSEFWLQWIFLLFMKSSQIWCWCNFCQQHRDGNWGLMLNNEVNVLNTKWHHSNKIIIWDNNSMAWW